VSGDSAVLTMTAELNETVSITQQYTLNKSGFLVGYSLITKGFNQVLAPSNPDLQMEWSLLLPLQEKEVQPERDQSTIYYQYGNGDLESISEREYEEEKAEGGGLQWVSFKQQFFNSTLIA